MNASTDISRERFGHGSFLRCTGQPAQVSTPDLCFRASQNINGSEGKDSKFGYLTSGRTKLVIASISKHPSWRVDTFDLDTYLELAGYSTPFITC